MKVCVVVISKYMYYYKAIYPLVVLRKTPFRDEMDRKRMHGVEDLCASRADTIFVLFRLVCICTYVFFMTYMVMR